MTKEKNAISYADRLFPGQDFGSHMYADVEPFAERICSVIAAYSTLDALSPDRFEQPDHITFEAMTSPPSQLAFFEMLLMLSGAKRVLEIGTFIGRASCEFARMLGDDGHVTTIEAYDVFADMAEHNFTQNSVAKQVTLLRGDAGTILTQLTGLFDFIFIDGSKQDYLDFSLKAIELVAPTGLIVVDDIFFHGDTINGEPTTSKGRGCKETLDYFRDYPHCRKVIIPAWNGTLLLYGFDRRC